VFVSYLEIYKEYGYDLLDENHSSKSLFDLPKVMMYEGADGKFTLKNLSVHRADNEEDALNLLFIGDTNRAVSETPKNDASTRSHCIFIIQIENMKAGSNVKLVSKLHIVDLSGSERVHKTGVTDENIIAEAKAINSGLFNLQCVIMALNKKAKGEGSHVPFRHSMMTMVLRDSLGGNCNTKMIATVSALEEDM
jgi:kinesin family protein 6/9